MNIKIYCSTIIFIWNLFQTKHDYNVILCQCLSTEYHLHSIGEKKLTTL